MSLDNKTYHIKQHLPWYYGPIYILIIIVFGALFCVKTALDKDQRLRNKLLQNAVILNNAIDLDNLYSLKNDSSDIQNPRYHILKNQLAKVCRSVEEFEFVYIVKLNKLNNVSIVINSENRKISGYSPQDQLNSVSNNIYIQTFKSGKETTSRIYTNQWGTWISALVPLKNPTNNQIDYLVCIDLNAKYWTALMIKECIMPAIITILFLILYISLIIRFKRSDREKQQLQFLSTSLQQSETKYRKIFENVQDVFFQTDKEGTIIEMSPSIERYSGYKRDELIGTKMDNYYYNADDRALFIQTLFQKGEVSDYEIQMKERSGAIINASINAHVWLDENKDLVGIEGTIRDINERKKIEFQLKKTNEELSSLNAMKDKFFSIIAHDIKNPFSHILGFAAILKNNISRYSPEQIQEFSSIIHTSAERTHSLLEELLAWSMSQSGNLIINKQKADITTICNDVIQQYSMLAQYKEIQITTEYTHLSDVFIDIPTIQTVIRNLLNNAIKFTNSSGNITIKTSESAPNITINIIDDGIGIAGKDVEKLFRLDTSAKTIGTNKEKGTGLGLILCKEFVEKNGGEIGATSEYGIGSTFYFTVPIYNENTI